MAKRKQAKPEGLVKLTREEAISLWFRVDSARTSPSGDLRDICDAIENGLEKAGHSLDADGDAELDAELDKLANDDKLADATLKKVIKQFDGAKGSGNVMIDFPDNAVENIRDTVDEFEEEMEEMRTEHRTRHVVI